MIRKIKLLFTGTGSCATGAYAKYVARAGLPCGHEAIFGPYFYEHALEKLRKNKRTAEASWLVAPFLDRPEIKDALVVQLIRHPKKVIESWKRIKVISGRYQLYRAVWCQRLIDLGRTWTGLAHQYVEWNKLIERKLAHRDYIQFAVDGDPLVLMRILQQRGFSLALDETDPVYKTRTINQHEPGRLNNPKFQFKLDNVTDREVRHDLEQMAERFGYKW